MLAAKNRRLIQIGAGRDGIAYRALDSERGKTIELRLLTAARNDSDRWPNLVRRLRLAASFHHPSVRTPLDLRLDDEPPTIVLPSVKSCNLAEAFTPKLPLPTAEIVRIGHRLADVLSAAHRLGLTHGRLDPNRVPIDSQQRLCLDFTGLDVGETTSFFPADEARWPNSQSTKAYDDIKDLGIILLWMATGYHSSPNDDGNGRLLEERSKDTSPASSLFPLIRQMLAIEPDDRPSACEVERRLFGLFEPHSATRIVSAANCDVTCSEVGLAVAPSRLLAESNEIPKQLGRFRLLDRIGSGGMGVVYRAEDGSDGSIVAVKVPLRDFQTDAEARLRFRKEGRLLAEVQNPFVARLLEINEDAGLLYLAMEFVEGPNLRRVLDEGGAMNEATALAVIADAARALAEAHRLGIVHRDIKLDNLVRVRDGDSYRVKLLDFGLARHVNQSESMQLTQTGHRLGTPLYMAPEQCRADGVVDARTDVYALGANLFHLLAGRPPFEGNSIVQMVAQHCNEAPPDLSRLRPELSEGLCRLIAKALSKLPQDRYADAGELLCDIERLQRGEPTTLTVHPHLPAHDPKDVVSYEWSWQLESKVEQLWPLVSNTERLNRAIGLPAIDYTLQTDPRGGTHRFGQFRKFGLTVAWEEHPFEWIENRRMAVLRQYHRGPLKWLISQVELTPRLGAGTLLTHRVHVAPLGLLGRLLAARQIGVETRRALDRVYRRMDAMQTGALGKSADAFEAPVRLSRGERERLHLSLEKLVGHGVGRGVVETLGEFLERAPVQEVARIRPLALAERLELPPEQVVAACLYGAREGLLVLLWDILCPLCRIPSEIKDTL